MVKYILLMIIAFPQYMCGMCSSQYDPNEAFGKHYRSSLNLSKQEKETFVCQYCNKELSSKYTLKNHEQNTCKGKDSRSAHTRSISSMTTLQAPDTGWNLVDTFKVAPHRVPVQYCHIQNKEFATVQEFEDHLESCNQVACI